VSVVGRQGIDEAWSRLTPQEAANAGITFVIGYVSQDPNKNLTRAEIDAYHAVGIDVLLIYEYSVTAVEGGRNKGYADAAVATSQAHALGYPVGCALGFAVDENETDHPGNIADYAAAFTDTCHQDGWRSFVYGGLATVSYALTHGLVDLAMQTYAWSTVNSVLMWDPRAAIRQYANGVIISGHDIDRDVAMVDDIGAWKASTMTAPSNEDVNVYDAMFYGGPSCGATVPEQFRVKGDANGNALLSKLDYLIHLATTATTPAPVLSDTDAAALATFNNLAGQIAAHLK
jgi:glycoside hydrolase-like protein